MSGIEESYAVQVVKVKDDHSYELDEEALKELLLRDDVKDLPVAVVSVAGAYRRGKSFLLNFFPRYLKATESQRNSCDWLGHQDSSLDGFRWRGGCDRETTGMYLWCEPIIFDCRGQKVAVLLMDTQGAFDSTSTVRDCSTIFALSTLLSSVQIYNLKENIQEDDLQHLHLFTEYGKLAQDQEERAFQALMFLVRDWPYPYQHPYGTVGGEQLLAKRLEINASHNEDMRNLRECIQSCFQSVTAFLMPHPGFEVAAQEFDGSLSNILPQFQTALLELLPAIFQLYLAPKVINGNLLKCRDLVDYFRIYMNIFNSNELPEPVTIMKATSEAALMAAEREAREVYDRTMEATCGPHQPSMPAGDILQAHQAALHAASDSFTSKKKMGSQKDIDDYLARIMVDLDSHLPSYEALNDAKLKTGCAKVNQVYEDIISEACGDQLLCLHPNDLDVLHMKAVAEAVEAFDTLRRSSNPEDDDERKALIQKLEDNIKDLRVKNEQNNMNAVMKAEEHYSVAIASVLEPGSCLSEHLLEQRHREALDSAKEMFESRRNMPNYEPEDIYLEKLVKNIEQQYAKNKLINKNANKAAVELAVNTYNNYITSAWSPQVYCLHPNDLAAVHSRAAEEALEKFTSNRAPGGDDTQDSHRNTLMQILERRFQELKDINVTCNNRAVDEAYNFYTNKMESKCKPSLLSVLLVPLVVKVASRYPHFHAECKRQALDLFRSRRRTLQTHSSDEYYSKLESKLDGGRDEYCDPLKAIAREFFG